jgi:hypothetical protein
MMPGCDRIEPHGAGPKSGRGMGFCSGYGLPGYVNQAARLRGYFGFPYEVAGHGRRHRQYATGRFGRVPMTTLQEMVYLKAQVDLIKKQLDAIQKRMEEITTD